jgi:hypothetical protein
MDSYPVGIDINDGAGHDGAGFHVEVFQALRKHVGKTFAAGCLSSSLG